MRLKNSSVNITNLHPRLRKKLPLLDVLHKELTSKHIMITSGNDGQHMDGSLHYSDRAIDFRIWDIDKLNEHKKGVFVTSLAAIFPEKEFDVVLESDHYHVEWDPKPVEDIPEPRIKEHITIPILDEKEPIKIKQPEIKVSLLEQIDRKSLLKGILNGTFRHFTKFNLFIRIKAGASDDQSLFGRLIELINVLIAKLRRTK